MCSESHVLQHLSFINLKLKHTVRLAILKIGFSRVALGRRHEIKMIQGVRHTQTLTVYLLTTESVQYAGKKGL